MAHRIMTIEDDDPIATNSEDDDKEQNLNLQREPKRKRRNKVTTLHDWVATLYLLL